MKQIIYLSDINTKTDHLNKKYSSKEVGSWCSRRYNWPRYRTSNTKLRKPGDQPFGHESFRVRNLGDNFERAKSRNGFH